MNDARLAKEIIRTLEDEGFYAECPCCEETVLLSDCDLFCRVGGVARGFDGPYQVPLHLGFHDVSTNSRSTLEGGRTSWNRVL